MRRGSWSSPTGFASLIFTPGAAVAGAAVAVNAGLDDDPASRHGCPP